MGATLADVAGRAAALVFAYMSLWFVVALLRRRNDLADVAWGLGFAVLAWAGVLGQPRAAPRMLLLAALTTIWGVRLAAHIWSRHRVSAEDPRYRRWREEWGRWWAVRSYLQVFLLQGVFMLLVSAPLLVTAAAPPSALGALDVAGSAVWAFGLAFEAVADAQLAAFKRDPASRGKVMQSGLWRYSRHPNYFGEVVLWWGVGIVALGVPSGWLGLIGPTTITFLLLKVSGVPMLERRREGGEAYEAYKRRTSVFLPLPPRDAR